MYKLWHNIIFLCVTTTELKILTFVVNRKFDLKFIYLCLQVQPEHSDAEGAGGRHPEAGSLAGGRAPEDWPAQRGAGQGAAWSAGDAQSQDAPDGDVREVFQWN